MPLSLKDLRPERGGFRKATMDDAALLYAWRLSAEQAEWWQGTPVSFREHSDWLRARVWNPLVKVLIWEVDEEPSGMVRIDSNGELAFWGSGPGMLQAATEYAAEYGGRLKVTIDEDDIGGVTALKNAGFGEHQAQFLAFKP